MSAKEEPDYIFIRDRLENGRVIPFLGAGASLMGAGEVEAEGVGGGAAEATAAPVTPPSATELARLLAEKTTFPEGESLELAKVAQYLKAIGGALPLYEKLHKIFSRVYPVAPLHTYLAEVAKAGTKMLVVTTNYDDLVERAFAEVEHVVVVHICDPDLGERVYWWQHTSPGPGVWEDSQPKKAIPNKLKIDLSKTNVIYKMHGTVDRREPSRDQYVIAEDDYIDFLTRMTKNSAVPAVIAEAFSSRHFLFLGYALRDWNLRVVLNRIKKAVNNPLDIVSWAIQRNPSILERRFWERRNVTVFDVDLNEFVSKLRGR